MNRNVANDLVNQTITLQPNGDGTYNILNSTVPSYKIGTITEQVLKSLQTRGIRCMITEIAQPGQVNQQILFG